MEILDVSPADRGERTLLTLSLTHDEAQKLVELLKQGKLASLGISDAVVSSNDEANHPNRKWAAREGVKRHGKKDFDAPNLPD
jgi:hypothetical protein